MSQKYPHVSLKEVKLTFYIQAESKDKKRFASSICPHSIAFEHFSLPLADEVQQFLETAIKSKFPDCKKVTIVKEAIE